MPQIKEKVYKDISLTFSPHPVTGNVPIVFNEQAIKQSLKNLLFTNRYERPYRPEFGGDILGELFENFDPFTEHRIRKGIKIAIQNSEPRVEVIKVDVGMDNDRQIIKATLTYRILNSKNPTEVSFFLERTR